MSERRPPSVVRWDIRGQPARICLSVLCAGLVAGLAACSGHADSDNPTTLLAAAGQGARLQGGGDGIVVFATLPKQESSYEYVSQVAFLAKRTAEAVQAGAADLPKGAKYVSLFAQRPDLDRLGNATSAPILAVDFAVSDLKAAKTGSLGAFGVLDLALNVKVPSESDDDVNEWCLVHDRAPNFCGRAKGLIPPADESP